MKKNVWIWIQNARAQTKNERANDTTPQQHVNIDEWLSVNIVIVQKPNRISTINGYSCDQTVQCNQYAHTYESAMQCGNIYVFIWISLWPVECVYGYELLHTHTHSHIIQRKTLFSILSNLICSPGCPFSCWWSFWYCQPIFVAAIVWACMCARANMMISFSLLFYTIFWRFFFFCFARGGLLFCFTFFFVRIVRNTY